MMVEFILNGTAVSCDAPTNIILLDLLRSERGVLSVKRGCEQGECGACTVLLDGRPVNSCMVLAARIHGREVTTIEGLRDEPVMAALRKAFMEGGAVQCGFCTPGMLVSAYALLRDNPSPTPHEAKTGIEGNICRCTGYTLPIESILKAAEMTPHE
jgi:carbon-monoxide dehydrogenase small subunit